MEWRVFTRDAITCCCCAASVPETPAAPVVPRPGSATPAYSSVLQAHNPAGLPLIGERQTTRGEGSNPLRPRRRCAAVVNFDHADASAVAVPKSRAV